MEQVKIYKFLDRPVPFTLIQDANKIKEEMISEFEQKYFKFWKRLIEFQSKEKNPAMIKPIAEFFNKVIISYAIAP